MRGSGLSQGSDSEQDQTMLPLRADDSVPSRQGVTPTASKKSQPATSESDDEIFEQSKKQRSGQAPDKPHRARSSTGAKQPRYRLNEVV